MARFVGCYVVNQELFSYRNNFVLLVKQNSRFHPHESPVKCFQWYSTLEYTFGPCCLEFRIKKKKSVLEEKVCDIQLFH